MLYSKGVSAMVKELTEKRRSFRTFDGRRPDQAVLDELMERLNTAQMPFAAFMEFRLLDNMSSPVISGTDLYIAGKCRYTEPMSEVMFGYVLEEAMLYMLEQGLGSVWIGGTMDRKAFEAKMDLQENEIMPAVTPVGYPARKMSLKETLMRKGVKADSRMPFMELFFRDSFGCPLTETDAGQYLMPLQTVQAAPSAVNKQPWRVVVRDGAVHFYERHVKGYVTEKSDMQKLDMGIAMCHFDLARKEAGLHGSWVVNDPGISTPENTEYIASFIAE
jgi:nitroreductase